MHSAEMLTHSVKTQLFAAGKYKEQLDEKRHTRNTSLLPLSPASLSSTGSLTIFFEVKHSFVGNCTGVALIEKLEEINITCLVLHSSA